MFLEKAASSRPESRDTSSSGHSAGRVRGRADFEPAKPCRSQEPKSKKSAGDRSAHAGSLQPEQIKVLVVVTTAATFNEELATCLEASDNNAALEQIFSTCSKTVKTIKPVTACQSSKEGQYWLALGRLSTQLTTTLKDLPDGDELLNQILDPLKPENGYEMSAQFANGAHQASRIQFWEMVAAHVETIEEALQGCSSSTQV